MTSLTNLKFFKGVLYLKTSKNFPLNRELYDILIQIDSYHRNELFVKEQELLDSVLNIPIFILECNKILTEELSSLDIIQLIEEDNQNQEHERVMMGFEDRSAKTIEELEGEIEELERVMMGFEDRSAKTIAELDGEIEEHENFMMGFQDYPAKTVEEMDRDKKEFFELINQRILFNLNLSIQNFLNFSSQVDDVFDEFDVKDLEYINNNILVNLIKINLNVFDFLNRFNLSNFFLLRKMILLQIKIISYEEETITIGKTQRGKIEMILNKKKINKECLKQIKRKIVMFISNKTLEVQGPDGGCLFQPEGIS